MKENEQEQEKFWFSSIPTITTQTEPGNAWLELQVWNTDTLPCL